MFDKMSKPKDVSIAQQKEEDKENQQVNVNEEKGTVKEEFIIAPFSNDIQENKKVDEPEDEILVNNESPASPSNIQIPSDQT